VSDELNADTSWLIHAGTKTEESTLKTSGGRVAAVVSKGDTPEHARTGAYDALKHVSFDGAQYRQDIGSHKEIQRN
jgi:phosphoribosylamine--glycine ligase